MEEENIKPEVVDTEVSEVKVSVNKPVEEKSVVFTDKPKKKVNVPAIILGILALVFAGAATFFGLDYFGIIGEEKVKEVVTIEKVPEEVIVEITTSTMAEEYKEVKDVMATLTDGMENNWPYIENGGGSLLYKPEGLNSYVPMKFSLGVKINNSNSNEANMALLDNKMESAGFSAVGVLPFLGSAGPRIEGYFNADKDIVCGAFADEYINLTCAKTSWAWLTDAERALTNDLGEAYREKEGKYPTVMAVSGSKIKDSEYAPYQTISVNLGGGGGLFYRVSPEAKWQLFAHGQAAPSCSEYDTEDLKKAYAGTVCWDYDGASSTESVVQP